MDAAGAGPLSAAADADGGAAGRDTGEARLRAAGVRVTRPRLAVLDVLERLAGHHGVDEISGALAARGAPLPLTTVYNVVDDLSRAGVLLAADAGPGRALYEVAEQRHHHFVCRSCGDVSDVPATASATPGPVAGLEGAEVEQTSVIFRGRCPACVATAPEAEERAWT